MNPNSPYQGSARLIYVHLGNDDGAAAEAELNWLLANILEHVNLQYAQSHDATSTQPASVEIAANVPIPGEQLIELRLRVYDITREDLKRNYV